MRKPSISKADALLRIHRFMNQGSSYVNASREIHEQFDVIEPVSVARSISRVRGIANNGGYSIESMPDVELVPDAGEVIHVNGFDDIVIGVDASIPGSDRSVCMVRTRKGSVVNVFRITREDDDFVVSTEDGSILGRGGSEEDVMRILQAMSEQLTADEPFENGAYVYLANGSDGPLTYTFNDGNFTVDEGKPGSDRIVYSIATGEGRVVGIYGTKEAAMKHTRAILARETLQESPEESLEDASRFDIIDIE